MDLYAKSGVDVGKAENLVDRLKEKFPSIGGYAGIFPLGKHKLAATCDGVGTKIKLAIQFDRHEAVGIDLVAMSVNDLIAGGAKPLFFLDYFSSGKLQPEIFNRVIKGIKRGIDQAGCILLGGEIAEMPGMYKNGDYDLAGFACGVIEREFKKKTIKKGDLIIGLRSNGIHSNGFSLVRKAFNTKDLEEYKNLILRPTKIYSGIIGIKSAKNLAHVTGGGIVRALKRLLPEEKKAEIFRYNPPKIFKLIEGKGIDRSQMENVFNMGWGMIMAVEEKNGDKAIQETGGRIIGAVR
jgi:phosphoribosylformylglycinamidine cyclo-ligase